jgi:hypothetical protein
MLVLICAARRDTLCQRRHLPLPSRQLRRHLPHSVCCLCCPHRRRPCLRRAGAPPSPNCPNSGAHDHSGRERRTRRAHYPPARCNAQHPSALEELVVVAGQVPCWEVVDDDKIGDFRAGAQLEEIGEYLIDQGGEGWCWPSRASASGSRAAPNVGTRTSREAPPFVASRAFHVAVCRLPVGSCATRCPDQVIEFAELVHPSGDGAR